MLSRYRNKVMEYKHTKMTRYNYNKYHVNMLILSVSLLTFAIKVTAIMRALLLFVLLIAPSLACKDFTLGGCVFNQDALITTFIIPFSDEAAATCQSLCEIEDLCNYFYYESTSETCRSALRIKLIQQSRYVFCLTYHGLF